ncbi:MAG: PKD domain-containing protein [Bacteroidota bacterium]
MPLSVSFETPTQAVAYQWDFGDGSSSIEQNPQHAYIQPGIYDVGLVITTTRGCRDTFLLEAAVTVEPGQVFFPSAFSPNGDPNNDTFGAIGEGFYNPQLQVFNRWGKMVYAGAAPWNGRTESGTDAPEGVYIYVWQANDLRGRLLQRNGTVTIIR